MKYFIFCITFSFNCLLNGQSFKIDQVLNATFNASHLNKWKIVNTIDNKIQDDSFYLIEGKIGDTSISIINEDVMVLISSQMSILTELRDGNVFIMPKMESKSPKTRSFNLPDSIVTLFDKPELYVLDSIGVNLFSTKYEGGNLKIKINSTLGVVEWMEYSFEDVEELESNGFAIEKNIVRTIRYELMSYEIFPNKIKQYIAINSAVQQVNEVWGLKPGFENFQLINLIEGEENQN